MKPKKLLAALLAAACFLGTTGCASQSIAATDLTKNVKKAEQIVCFDEDTQDKTIEEVTGFGVRLLQNEMEKNNPLLSPLSIVRGSMTVNGARRRDKNADGKRSGRERLDTLFFHLCCTSERKKGRQADELPTHLAQGHADAASKMRSCSRMDSYAAEIFSAPFDDSTKTAINDWVSRQTDKMIPKILDEIPGDAVMYLVSALAFDAKWDRPFKSYEVWDGAFTARNGQEQTGDFLHGTVGQYLSDEHAEGFLKPYADGKYAFAALLPDKTTNIENYVNQLTGERLHAILASPIDESVEIALPKFRAEFSAELSENLKALGMTDAFDGANADFTALGTSDEGNIYISRVLHKTFIQVDEEGTKAGAATAVEAATGSAALYPHSVLLNRPFVYMIVDLETGLPIFLGALTALPEV